MNAKDWIQHLGLLPHPEGGYYKETYRSKELIDRQHLPQRFTGSRSFSTCIYFLLTSEKFSAFHRIKQDETWHFYDGAPLTLHVIDTVGNYQEVKLGKDIAKGEQPQVTITAGCLFGASVMPSGHFTLTGATVAPGFDFEDFEMPTRAQLLEDYPMYKDIIHQLTHT